ncbi:MAG: CPBP family intramembrane metalloprotease [Prolixibacteraceae bacterium]|nr:CPBP family intramembrane metalloprotease [Prolixibacteraceae bacterium]MBN2774293.1 CPBP family intramembrane metalloprotease [Prolixibacteraceae bacterium]
MAFTAFRGSHPFSQLILSVFIIIVCFIIFMVGSVIIAIPLFGIDSVTALPTLDDMSNPESVRILKYFQVVQSIGLFIIPPFIIAWLFKGKIAEYLYLNKKLSGLTVVLVILLIFFANPAINFIGSLNAKMVFPEWLSWLEDWMRSAEDKAAVLTEAFLDVKTIQGLIFNLFMIAFLPAIGEELLFRGVIQKIFAELTKNVHLGVWISAFIFSAFHLQFYGFLPRFLLGLMFGYLLVWSGSMWLPIIAHFINNAAAVIGMWMVSQEKIDPAIEEIGSTSESLYVAIISLVLSSALFYLIYRQNRMEPGSKS